MIQSMTAFSRQEIQNKDWTATWEIRSLNQRYLDIQIYLPEILHTLEIDIRKQINTTNSITRGRIECKLHININNNNTLNKNITLNTELIKNLIKLIKDLPHKRKIGKIDPIKILSWPGVITQKKINIYQIYPKISQSFKNTLNELIKNREKEGINLKKIIENRLSKISNEINNIKKEIPSILTHQKEKLLKKIKEINIDIKNSSNNRLEEELIIYTQRSDISEEIDRLKIHIENVYHILCNEKVIGRKLDFIMQELHREINTISSKSMNIKITQSTIEIKVLIDQIREQTQNIE